MSKWGRIVEQERKFLDTVGSGYSASRAIYPKHLSKSGRAHVQ